MLFTNLLITSGEYWKTCDKTYTCFEKENIKTKQVVMIELYFFIYQFQVIISNNSKFTGKKEPYPNIMVCLQLFTRSKRTWLFSKPVRTWNMKHMAKLGLVLFSYLNTIVFYPKMWWVSTNRFENFDRLIVKGFSERFNCVIWP